MYQHDESRLDYGQWYIVSERRWRDMGADRNGRRKRTQIVDARCGGCGVVREHILSKLRVGTTTKCQACAQKISRNAGWGTASTRAIAKARALASETT